MSIVSIDRDALNLQLNELQMDPDYLLPGKLYEDILKKQEQSGTDRDSCHRQCDSDFKSKNLEMLHRYSEESSAAEKARAPLMAKLNKLNYQLDLDTAQKAKIVQRRAFETFYKMHGRGSASHYPKTEIPRFPHDPAKALSPLLRQNAMTPGDSQITSLFNEQGVFSPEREEYRNWLLKSGNDTRD